MAVIRTKPNGRVLGVDIIPAQPLKGVSAVQGNFLDPNVQAHVQWLLGDSKKNASSETNGRDIRPDDGKRRADVVLSDMFATPSTLRTILELFPRDGAL